MSRSRSVSSACSIKFRASQSCGIKTMGRVPRLALERGRYQGEPEHYLPHRTQGTEKREGPALYPEEQNRQPYPSASRISCSDLEPSSDATSDLEPSHPTPRSAEWFPRQPRGGAFVFRGGGGVQNVGLGAGVRVGGFEYGPSVGLLSQNRNPARASWARITFQPGSDHCTACTAKGRCDLEHVGRHATTVVVNHNVGLLIASFAGLTNKNPNLRGTSL